MNYLEDNLSHSVSYWHERVAMRLKVFQENDLIKYSSTKGLHTKQQYGRSKARIRNRYESYRKHCATMNDRME